MKTLKIIKLILFLLCIPISSFCQQSIPIDIQKVLDNVKSESKERLFNYRINNITIYPKNLMNYFEFEQRDQIDSLGLELNYRMIYDDTMVYRMIQLVNNEYAQYELDTLINWYMKRDEGSLRRRVLEKCQFDTITSFKIIYDSISQIWDSENGESWEGQYKKGYWIPCNLILPLCSERH